MLLVPYAVLVLRPTAGSGVLAVALRAVRLADGELVGMSCSEMAGDAPLLLPTLLAVRAERRVDMVD